MYRIPWKILPQLFLAILIYWVYPRDSIVLPICKRIFLLSIYYLRIFAIVKPIAMTESHTHPSFFRQATRRHQQNDRGCHYRYRLKQLSDSDLVSTTKKIDNKSEQIGPQTSCRQVSAACVAPKPVPNYTAFSAATKVIKMSHTAFGCNAWWVMLSGGLLPISRFLKTFKTATKVIKTKAGLV